MPERTKMRFIGLLSDTHGYYHPSLENFFKDIDELWHAGDIGNSETLQRFRQLKPTRAVFGNIDGADLRSELNETESFFCEEVHVLLTHIGGYPGRYPAQIKKLFLKEQPDLFICGHSHILKVMYDKDFQFLHINPGAAGIQGFHHRITAVRFKIEGQEIFDLDVFDAPRNF